MIQPNFTAPAWGGENPVNGHRVFTNEACLLRLVSAILLEIDQQWSDGKRVYIGTVAALKSPALLS